jgi:hypothetical protein
MTQAAPTSLPPENLRRGVIFALVALPVGVVAWDLLWSFGFVASIVAFGVSYLAVRMYRFGSGGRITRSGAIAVTVITIGTLIIAFISGFAVDVIGEYSRITGQSISESLGSTRFWSIVFADMTDPKSLISLLLAAAFGALGCYGTLRAAFRQTRVLPAGAATTTDATVDSAQSAAEAIATPAAEPTTRPADTAPPRYGVRLNGEPVASTDDESHDKK